MQAESETPPEGFDYAEAKRQMPKLDDDKWVKDFVALLKPQAPADKTDAELEEFARTMLVDAKKCGEAMSEIVVDGETGGGTDA
jgi:hypothetical protein